jgi:hypothetical protein
MRVLVGCEESGVVRDAFARRGHDAWSCDILPRAGKHIRGDIRDQDLTSFDLFICFPPCTYLCRSGQRWLKHRDGTWNKSRCEKMQAACNFFTWCLKLGPRVAVENPLMHCHARKWIDKPTQIIQPWMFGHGETKATGLWLRGLPLLKPTKIVEGREGRVHKESPGPLRARNRSRTLVGVAEAMSDQWIVF